MRISSLLRSITGCCALASLVAAPRVVSAQSLRGSPASVRRMYDEARQEHLAFYETSRGVRRAVAAGQLVRLVPDENFTLHEVAFPFVRPATRTFVERLSERYVDACGTRLEVTSAVRPATRQPANSVAESVHPTGMAIDLHKPASARCRSWLRNTLKDLENAGVLEATEEFSPPHFHVAVFPSRYAKYVASRTATPVAGLDATAAYRVRAGDTLWDIAQLHGTTVDAIATLNGLDEDEPIQPGQALIIPRGG